jgi:uncharacterized protein YraI
MNPRLTIRRHGRAFAVVGALVAVSATTTMALVAGTAAAAPSASQPGKCVDNVNVRSEPSADAEIVAVCERGTAVQVDQTRNGFVHLVDLKGWAAREYVSVNGKTPPTPSSRATTTSTAAPTTTGGQGSGERGSAPTAGATPGTSGNDIGDQNAGDPTTDPGQNSTGSPDQGNGQSPSRGLFG